ncbi:MAG: DUF560 domain-containing protein [Gammaproteobacteria bacterium]|nr:DUF560 domain-containing protein [Gammaproteobacteria bacterium]
MTIRTNTFIAMLLAGILIAPASHAADDRFDVEIDASAGMLSDSNVGIADLDTNSGESDTATRLTAGISGKLKISGPLTVRAGFDVDDTAYLNASQFDLGMQHLFAEMTFNRKGFAAAVTADNFDASLDGEGYLEVSQISPSLSQLFGNKLFVRGALTQGTKIYAGLVERNADNESLRLDTYLLFNGMNHYLAFGVQSGSEDARDDVYDYDAVQFNVSYGRSISLSKMTLKLRAKLRSEQRDYTYVPEDGGESREDDRLRLSLSATVPLSKYFELDASAEKIETASSFDAANLDKTVYSVKLSASF